MNGKSPVHHLIRLQWIPLEVLFLLLVGSLVAATVQDPPKQQNQKQTRSTQKPVTRAKRPTFEKATWQGIFFEDIFSEGLVGPRPDTSQMIAGNNAAEATTDPATTDATGTWVELIDSAVLENEVKRWQQELAAVVTTPVKYKTTNLEISDKFSMLAMLFSVIGQYEDQVRWKDAAYSARAAFVDAAVSSRDSDLRSFNNAKQRSEDLTELVRGGKFPDEPGASNDPAVADWSMVVDHTVLMNRLESTVATELKEPTSSEDAFKDAVDIVIHEANMVAAMGRVLQLPEMLYSEDEDYRKLAQEMISAGQDMKAAALRGNLDAVNESLNRLNQSCTDCHGDCR